jgi:hypothetical protein
MKKYLPVLIALAIIGIIIVATVRQDALTAVVAALSTLLALAIREIDPR